MNRPSGLATRLALFVMAALQLSACVSQDKIAARAPANIPTDPCQGSEVTGSAWVPNVTGAGSGNHLGSVSETTTVLTGTGKVIGFADPAPAASEITVQFDVTQDLGPNGSITLVAETTQFPSELLGSAYPLLVYLSDGNQDWIRLSRSGGSDCAGTGFFTCVGMSCPMTNTNCTVSSPSAFASRRHWQQHQIAGYGYLSVNKFPTCNWTSGSPACAFNSDFFVNGKLRTGTYTAKYVLLSGSYPNLSNKSAGLKVSVVQKADPNVPGVSGNGAIDLNVILVGTSNIRAAHTAKGQQNLNLLLSQVMEHYNQSGVGVKLGKINAVEWSCRDGGDALANIDIDSLDFLFEQGSQKVPSNTNGKAVNLFLVSTIPNGGGGGTILGVSSTIGGPPIHGTGASGIAFSSFNKLGSFNPNCTLSGCPVTAQEAAFIDMSSTVAHEIGHYLGLNHPSERTGSIHDNVPDTPQCSAEVIGGNSYVTSNSCRATGSACRTACPNYDGVSQFCPAVSDCQFNHVMWWTSKGFLEGSTQGDGNLFSPNSSSILLGHPLIQ